METLFETLLFILPWFLLGITLLMYGHKLTQYTSVRQELKEALESNKRFMNTIEEYRTLYNQAMETASNWEKLATCPPIQPTPDINIIEAKMKRVCSKITIPKIYPYGRVSESNFKDHYAFKKAQHDFLQRLDEFVFSEARIVNQDIDIYFEIYVAKPEK